MAVLFVFLLLFLSSTTTTTTHDLIATIYCYCMTLASQTLKLCFRSDQTRYDAMSTASQTLEVTLKQDVFGVSVDYDGLTLP
jgi:hypothetical protein